MRPVTATIGFCSGWSPTRYSGENIVGRRGTADALKFKLANSLDRDGILDRHQHARADQNLTGFGFVAEVGVVSRAVGSVTKSAARPG
jgi:hypothetical protein